MQIFKPDHAGALIGPEIPFVGLNEQIVEAREDHVTRCVAVDFLAGSGDELLLLLLVGPEIAF